MPSLVLVECSGSTESNKRKGGANTLSFLAIRVVEEETGRFTRLKPHFHNRGILGVSTPLDILCGNV